MLTRSYRPQGKKSRYERCILDYISQFVVQQRVSNPVGKGQVLECTPYDFKELHEGIIIRLLQGMKVSFKDSNLFLDG